MNKKNTLSKSLRTVVSFIAATALFLTALSLTSCKEDTANRVIIWTDCSEFAQYIELFNNTHTDTKAILVYKENPAASLPPAKDELFPDIIVGSWLRTDSTIKNFKNLTYLFDRKILLTSSFYPELIESGKKDNQQLLLPVSFNLPAIIFSTENKDLISDAYTLNLEQIREIASGFNKKNKKGAFTRIGFIPSSNNDFLYLASKINGSNFHDDKGQIVWNQDKLDNTVELLKEWINTENGSASTEQDFAFKYLFMPDYRQVTSGKTLFSYITSDRLFKILKDQKDTLDYRWIRNEDSIPLEDSFTMLGIYKDAQNQFGANEFITWFFNSENQEAILNRKSLLDLDTELFGISGGFSSLLDVTEHIIPIYYNQLLTNLPPHNMITVPQKLPSRWTSYKNSVVEPYIKNAVMSVTTEETEASENTATITMEELEKEWRKKVFD